MPRSKVKLAFIEDSKARKSSYMKRKEGLKNKLKELSILCDIEACAIIYSSFEPVEVWPEDKTVFQNVLNQFLSKSPMERSKFMLNQESYIKERINKVKEQINKQVSANREMVVDNMLSDCLSGKVLVADLNPTDVNALVSLTNHKLSEIEERFEVLKIDAPEAVQPSQPEPSQPQEAVDGGNVASQVAEEGTNGLDLVPGVDAMDNTEWYPLDWTSDNVGNGLDLVPGFDAMKSFPDDPVSSWSGAYVPKTD